jgi:hypothetical protein
MPLLIVDEKRGEQKKGEEEEEEREEGVEERISLTESLRELCNSALREVDTHGFSEDTYLFFDDLGIGFFLSFYSYLVQYNATERGLLKNDWRNKLSLT